MRALVEFYIYKKEPTPFLWPPTTTFNIDLISQTDRKGGRCILVRILSIEQDINTLTMGAGTHVIFNIVFHITSCQIPNPIRTVGGYICPHCHVFAFIFANTRRSALKKLFPIISLEKGSTLFTP